MAARATWRSGYGGGEILAIGLRRRLGRDLYHSLLTASWPSLLLLVVAAYVAVNAAFALAYLALGDGVANARAGSFGDAFFFSVQTLATIGYGKMAPRTTAANVLVAAEALLGLLGLAVVTGLTFAKFSRPTARVLFSRIATVAPYDGVPSLLFRLANERASQIVDAHLEVTIVRDEITAEGERVRRMRDLALRRDRSAFFALTWTAVHSVDASSPLHGATPESLARTGTDIVVSLTGFDESLAQIVHARHVYRPSDVVFGARFRDVLSERPDGTRSIDYRRFHELEALAPVDEPRRGFVPPEVRQERPDGGAEAGQG